VIADPLSPPATKDTIAYPLPAVADMPVGAAGADTGIATTPADAGPAPTPFTAFKENVYAAPFTSPVITMGLSVEETAV
jgi:hypothetical protein